MSLRIRCWEGYDAAPYLRSFTAATGINATAEGGIFGRADAVFISVDAQKSKGSLHGHGQYWVQCMHQHTPLSEVLRRLKDDGGAIVELYLRYKAYVCRQVTQTPSAPIVHCQA